MHSTPFTLERRRLTALRLASQQIGTGGLSTPADVVRWMLAMQTQDLPGAKWSVGLRAPRTSSATVEMAVDSGEIVRSWPMRGTLHLVPAEDLGWMLDLTAPRAIRAAASRRAALGIADADVDRARQIVEASLSGGRALIRDAILASIAAGGVSTEGQRGYHLLWYLAQTGTLVLGAGQGKQQAFSLLDEWVRAPRRLVRDEALGELALRYFRSHGPATARDLARWSGLTMADVQRGLAVSERLLTAFELGGVRYHLAPEALAQAPGPARVHLLPGFDEYLLGYGDRTAALALEHSADVVPGGNGMFKPTVVADGEVVGTWRRTVTRGEIVVEPLLWSPLRGALHDGLVEAVDAYGAYLGLPARLLRSPTTRPWRTSSGPTGAPGADHESANQPEIDATGELLRARGRLGSAP